MIEADKLREQAEVLIKRAAELDAISSTLRPATAFSPEQKIALFNDLHRRCCEYIVYLLEQGHELKDWDHYLAEEVLEKILGDGIWELLKGDWNGRSIEPID